MRWSPHLAQRLGAAATLTLHSTVSFHYCNSVGFLAESWLRTTFQVNTTDRQCRYWPTEQNCWQSELVVFFSLCCVKPTLLDIQLISKFTEITMTLIMIIIMSIKTILIMTIRIIILLQWLLFSINAAVIIVIIEIIIRNKKNNNNKP